jgi:hypothetical protein
MGEEPEKNGEKNADDETRDDGKIKGDTLAAMDDVAGKMAEAEGEPATGVEEGADKTQQDAENQENAAKVAEGNHEESVREEGREVKPEAQGEGGLSRLRILLTLTCVYLSDK